MMSDRYAEHRLIARNLGVDAIALVPGANFIRLFHHSFGTNERPIVVLIPVDGKPAAIMPSLELGSFAELDFEGAVFEWRDQDGYSGAFSQLAKHLPLQSIAVEGQSMRVFVHHALQAVYPNLRIVDAERQISGLRLLKTDDEITALEKAIRISEAALETLFSTVRIGMTEKQAENILVSALFDEGAESLSFSPIVLAAEASALPHASARTDYVLKAGDPLLVDFGARWGGMAADVTRTVFLGHATEEGRAVYDAVLSANRAGQAATRAGVTAHDIDDTVMKVLEATPFSDRIACKTGHGLGRDVHEEPYIMRGNHQILEAGMVFTNEPGLYQIGNFGVRIEDVLLVTETGSRELTSFPKELRIVG